MVVTGFFCTVLSVNPENLYLSLNTMIVYLRALVQTMKHILYVLTIIILLYFSGNESNNDNFRNEFTSLHNEIAAMKPKVSHYNIVSAILTKKSTIQLPCVWNKAPDWSIQITWHQHNHPGTLNIAFLVITSPGWCQRHYDPGMEMLNCFLKNH